MFDLEDALTSFLRMLLIAALAFGGLYVPIYSAVVADHLGHRHIPNTRVYAQITNPLREQVFRELEQHPKIVRV